MMVVVRRGRVVAVVVIIVLLAFVDDGCGGVGGAASAVVGLFGRSPAKLQGPPSLASQDGCSSAHADSWPALGPVTWEWTKNQTQTSCIVSNTCPFTAHNHPSHISLLSSRLCCLEKQEDCLLSRDLGYFGVGEL